MRKSAESLANLCANPLFFVACVFAHDSETSEDELQGARLAIFCGGFFSNFSSAPCAAISLASGKKEYL